MTTVAFDRCLAILLGWEGGYSCEREDPGNWTGHAVGAGELRGTKFGISAAAYPTVDIVNLTPDGAAAIYRRDYWDPIRADELPAQVVLLVFDAAVNNGVRRATEWLQAAAGVAVDGKLGKDTMAAVHAKDAAVLAREFVARRLAFMGSLPTWRTYGLGWARRLTGLTWQIAQIEAGVTWEAAQVTHN